MGPTEAGREDTMTRSMGKGRMGRRAMVYDGGGMEDEGDGEAVNR